MKYNYDFFFKEYNVHGLMALRIFNRLEFLQQQQKREKEETLHVLRVDD